MTESNELARESKDFTLRLVRGDETLALTLTDRRTGCSVPASATARRSSPTSTPGNCGSTTKPSSPRASDRMRRAHHKENRIDDPAYAGRIAVHKDAFFGWMAQTRRVAGGQTVSFRRA